MQSELFTVKLGFHFVVKSERYYVPLFPQKKLEFDLLGGDRSKGFQTIKQGLLLMRLRFFISFMRCLQEKNCMTDYAFELCVMGNFVCLCSMGGCI